MTGNRDLRAEILEATWTILRNTGFDGFKVQQVIARVGTSTRAFYNEFADKDALFVALMQDEYSRSAARLERVVESLTDPVEQVGAWVRELVLAAGDPRRAARARLFASQPALMHRFPEAFEAADQLLRRPLVMAVGRGREQGLFTPGDPGTDAELISQLAGASMNHALGGTDPVALEATIAAVVDFCLRALGHLAA
jgi:AcrR family transcriptional regulator